MRRFIVTFVVLIFGAIASAQELTPVGALIQMDSVSHDFGRVTRRGNALSHTFTATNIGGTPLVITEGSTTCSCIKVKHPKRPIAPQQSAPIEVRYELERKDIGPFLKVIKIFSNSSDGGCQVLTIYGISEDE